LKGRENMDNFLNIDELKYEKLLDDVRSKPEPEPTEINMRWIDIEALQSKADELKSLMELLK